MIKYILLLSIVSAPNIGFPCGCDMWTLFEESISKSEKAFIGHFVSAEIKHKKNFSYVEATFEVINSIKGNVGKMEIITTGFGTGDCGVPMTLGQKYPIFLTNNTNGISVCGLGSHDQISKRHELIKKLELWSKKYN